MTYATDSFTKLPIELIDPNSLSKDGTVAPNGTAVNDDAKLFAYGLETAGSDWQQWKVRDVATGKDQTDDLNWIKFSGASMKDGSGFFYSRYDEPKGGNKLRAQVLQPEAFLSQTTPRAEDKLVYERPPNGDAAHSFIGNEGATFWFRSDLNAPLGRTIALDTTQPLPAKPNEWSPNRPTSSRG